MTELRSGQYQPSPVKRVEIDKPDGGKRQLGIPTVADRVIQQAIAQILTPIFDPAFSDNSCGRIGLTTSAVSGSNCIWVSMRILDRSLRLEYPPLVSDILILYQYCSCLYCAILRPSWRWCL
jgi:hypothetical protein